MQLCLLALYISSSRPCTTVSSSKTTGLTDSHYSLLQCTDPNLGHSTNWPCRPKSTLTNSPPNLDTKLWNIKTRSTAHTDWCHLHYGSTKALLQWWPCRPKITVQLVYITHMHAYDHRECNLYLLYHPSLHWSTKIQGTHACNILSTVHCSFGQLCNPRSPF